MMLLLRGLWASGRRGAMASRRWGAVGRSLELRRSAAGTHRLLQLATSATCPRVLPATHVPQQAKRWIATCAPLHGQGSKEQQPPFTPPSASATAFRTHVTREINEASVGQTVTLSGWVASKRVIGDALLFISLRDHYGTVQLQITDTALIESLVNLPIESTVQATGIVTRRPEDQIREDDPSGTVEISVTDSRILCANKHTPFSTRDDAVKEELRLLHRPYDLRRGRLQHFLKARDNTASAARQCLNKYGFMDIETPTLFKRTPGGANEFLVPTQAENKFYALVQSPQQYKQMLMIGGIDRYYQFARCYRDEGGRVDRQPEFTQIDLEMSFVQQDDIMNITEDLVRSMWKAGVHVSLPPGPFKRMAYSEAMHTYGVDKPDTRFAMLLQDVTKVLAGNSVNLWKRLDGADDPKIIAMRIDNVSGYFSRKAIRALQEHAKGINAPTPVVCSVSSDGMITSSIAKELPEDMQRRLVAQVGARPGDAIILAADAADIVYPSMGKLRVHLASELNEKGLLALDPSEFRFLWVVDFPMFEPHEFAEDRMQASHHPFTAPMPEDVEVLRTHPWKARAQHFDLVVNGVELGGGSVRIHDPDMQEYVLGTVLKEDVSVFKQLLQALEYGAPPHGGIALGFDRAMLVMLAQYGAQSLRDVIAFPKSSTGKELMSGAPSAVSEEELAVYHINTLKA